MTGQVQTTVKALIFDDAGRVLLLRETSGFWDLPGGRLETGESLVEGLKRECREEMGIECDVLDALPRLVWCAMDKDGNWRVMLCLRATADVEGILPGAECEEHRFCAPADLTALPLYPQTRPLAALI